MADEQLKLPLGASYFQLEGYEMFIKRSIVRTNTNWVLGALLCGVTGISVAANPVFPRIASVDTVVKDDLIKQNIVGAAVAVFENGRIVHAAGYGHKDLARQTPVTTNTVFRWASISKPLTAVAALKLDETDQQFNIEDRVTSHVSYWPTTGQKRNITIKQLLSNRSGIIHYSSKSDCPGNANPSYNRNKHGNGIFNAKKAVDVFKDQDLCFAPGSDYRYSTFGFTVVAAALEKQARMSYNDWVLKSVARPLGLTSLRQATGTSRGFKASCGALTSATEASKSYVLPGGGWESNIVDLAKFANGIAQGSILDDTDRLWTESTGNNRYRLGITREFGGDVVSHGGAHSDTRTHMYVFPSSTEKRSIVIYTNGAHGNPARTARRVAMALGDTRWNEKDTATVPLCESNCSDSFAGVWRKTQKDVVIRLGLAENDFSTEWRHLRSAGYYLDDFEARSSGNSVKWDGVFRKGSGGNAMWRNFSRDGFSAKWKEQSGKGYRLVDVETYTKGGRRYWAGLFRPGSGKYALHRYYDTDDFGAKHKSYASQGLKLIDVEPFRDNGKLKWAGVWVAGNGAKLNRNYSTSEFGDLRTTRQSQGWKLVDIERYTSSNKVLWAGVWENSSLGEKLNRNYPMCGEKNDDGEWTDFGILNRHDQWRNAGFELIDWERN